MFRAILAKKLAVNSNSLFARDLERYLLVSDQRLYTLEPEKIDSGIVTKSEVIVKQFDMTHLKHIVFMCDSAADQLACIECQLYNEQKELPTGFNKRLEKKSVTLVISMSDSTNEKDVALGTNMLVLLQLLFSFQAAKNYKVEKHLKQLLSTPDGVETFKNDARRGSSSLPMYENFPLYIVNQQESGKTYKVGDIYRKD